MLDVQGGVVINSYKPEVSFQGTVSIADLQFGDFSVVYTKQGVGMHVSIGKSFGPVSLNVTVNGAMGFSPFAFYLEGSGNACLFICLSVDGLISNEGLAACGSINLLLVTFSGGFAVMWSGPNSGVHLFTGCDLSPFIPPTLRNIQTSPDDRARPPTARISRARSSRPARQTPRQSCSPAGPSSSTLCPPSAPATCPNSTVAVSVHSLLSQEAVGVTPQVTLSGPDGRVVTTPTTAGYYGFEGSATMSGGNQNPGQTFEGTSLVDQNAVPVDDTASDSAAYCAPPAINQTLSALPSTCPKVTTTTMYIGAPGAGDWTLSVDGTSPPIEDVSIAPQQAPVTASQFNPTVRPVVLNGTSRGFDLRVGGHTFSSSLLGQRHRLLLTPSVEVPEPTAAAYKSLAEHPLAKDLDVPAIDVPRLRAVLLKVPSTFEGSAAILDEGAAGSSQVLASGITSSGIPSGGMPLLFQPMPNAGRRQRIVAFLSNSAGMPSREITLSSFSAPPARAPAAEDSQDRPRRLHGQGVLRTGQCADRQRHRTRARSRQRPAVPGHVRRLSTPSRSAG